MIVTHDQIEAILGAMELPEGVEWLREEAIIHLVDMEHEGRTRTKWVAYLMESGQEHPIVATIEIGMVTMSPGEERPVEKLFWDRVNDAAGDIREMRRRVDAEADDAGGV